MSVSGWKISLLLIDGTLWPFCAIAVRQIEFQIMLVNVMFSPPAPSNQVVIKH